MDYLLKASGLVIILFLFYYSFLRHETFFKSIRGYFLGGLLLVISLPLIEIPVYIEQITNPLNGFNYTTISSPQLQFQKSFNWVESLTASYLLGVLFFSVKFIIQLISLGILLSNHKLTKQGEHYYVETSKNISPFSFFNIIVYNKSQFTIAELEQIINHEKAHVLQWHSIDTILAHLLVITLWFNPFVWLFKKAVQQNLEFLADEHAMELAKNQKLYQLTLLKTCNTNYCTEITNNFYNSLIKKRITMLHKSRSENKSQWKYALLLPLLVAFVFMFNTKTIAQEKKLVKIQKINKTKVDILIDKNSTNESLENEKALFKKEFDITLSFKGIKRNKTNEITAIKLDAKGANLKAKFENSGNEPIKPIIISYDSENNSLNISNAKKAHKNNYTYTIHEDEDGNQHEEIEIINNPNKDGNYVFVTSEGKTKTWTSKDKRTKKLIVKEIHTKGDKKNIWVHEKDGDNINVEVIEDGEHKVKILKKVHKNNFDTNNTEEIKIKIIEDTDNASEHENVYIIKTDDDDQPLYIIDGKEISKKEMDKINSKNIESINVLKGESAIKKYGAKAENGVIEITKKKQ